jgi:hypothetical protein
MRECQLCGAPCDNPEAAHSECLVELPGLRPRYISRLNENIQSENKAIDAYLRSWKWPTRLQFQKNNCEIIRSISAQDQRGKFSWLRPEGYD